MARVFLDNARGIQTIEIYDFMIHHSRDQSNFSEVHLSRKQIAVTRPQSLDFQHRLKKGGS